MAAKVSSFVSLLSFSLYYLCLFFSFFFCKYFLSILLKINLPLEKNMKTIIIMFNKKTIVWNHTVLSSILSPGQFKLLLCEYDLKILINI